MVRPIITYTLVRWLDKTYYYFHITGFVVEDEHFSLQIKTKKRFVCLLITGAMTITPTVAIKTMLNMSALHVMARTVFRRNCSA